jgi:hypothetical protein
MPLGCVPVVNSLPLMPVRKFSYANNVAGEGSRCMRRLNSIMSLIKSRSREESIIHQLLVQTVALRKFKAFDYLYNDIPPRLPVICAPRPVR